MIRALSGFLFQWLLTFPRLGEWNSLQNVYHDFNWSNSNSLMRTLYQYIYICKLFILFYWFYNISLLVDGRQKLFGLSQSVHTLLSLVRLLWNLLLMNFTRYYLLELYLVLCYYNMTMLLSILRFQFLEGCEFYVVQNEVILFVLLNLFWMISQ